MAKLSARAPVVRVAADPDGEVRAGELLLLAAREAALRNPSRPGSSDYMGRISAARDRELRLLAGKVLPKVGGTLKARPVRKRFFRFLG